MQDDFDQARAHFLEGVAHFEAQRPDNAERCFVASLQRLPGQASTRINLAATRLLLGRAAEALAELEAVLAAEPQHVDAWCHRAAALANSRPIRPHPTIPKRTVLILSKPPASSRP